MKIVKKWWIWAVAVSVVTIVAMLLCPPVFYLNDDITMRSILSGTYTGVPDGHAVYMKYPLTGVLALLYKMVHFCPWFDLFLMGCIWGCMVLLIFYMEKPYVGFCIATAIYLPFCFYMHYTIVAALVAATAVFLIAIGRKPMWSVVLLWVAYMIRSQVGWLSLPFVAAAVVWRLTATTKDARKKESLYLAKYGIALMAGILLCGVINYCFYVSDGWKHYTLYNDSRTLLYDYTDFLSTDSYANNYEEYGMTLQEYDILKSYDTMLAADIDEVRIQEIAERVSDSVKNRNSTVERLKDTIKKYYLQIRYSDRPFNYLWIGVCLFLGIGFVFAKKWKFLAVLCILEVGRSSIWMYLIWQGRFPERVSVSLYLLELMLLFGMCVRPLFTYRAVSKWIKLGTSVVCSLIILAVGMCQWQITAQRLMQQTEIQGEWTALKKYCEQEKNRVFLVDVFSAVEYADLLFTEDAPNVMLLGGWLSSSPLTQKRFEKLGHEDGAECLYYDEQVSLIVEADYDVTWLEQYLQNRFGECALVETARIDGSKTKAFLEYRVVRNEE